MNRFIKSLSVLAIVAAALISCKDAKTSSTDAADAKVDTAVIKAELKSVIAEAPMTDTVGVHNVGNPEAIAFLVDMNKILGQIDQAVDDNALDRMPALMSRQSELQQKQIKIQSALSEKQREVFKVYANKIADRLLIIADKMSTKK